MRRRWDLLALAAATIAGACAVLLLPEGPARSLGAAIVCLVAPGYALTAALFPPGAIVAAIRLMSTLLLGLATLAVGAVLLHPTRVGVTDDSWTRLLVAVTLGACVVAFARTPATPRAPRSVAIPRVSLIEAGLLLVAGLAVTAGVALSRTPLRAPNVIGHTQVWMFPAGSAGGTELRVGVRSAETRTQAYRLELSVGGVRRVIRSRVVLAPGDVHEQRVRLPPIAPSPDPTRVTLRVRPLDQPCCFYLRVNALVPSR